MIFSNNNQKVVFLPLTDMQKEMFAAITLKQCDYAISTSLFLEEPIHVVAMKTALEKLMEKQSALSSVFRDSVKYGPVQVVLSETITPFYIDEKPSALDIATEPWNLVWDSQQQTLTLQYCHIVMDGWSMALFWKFLLELYQSAMTGKELPPLRTKSLQSYHVIRAKLLEDIVKSRPFCGEHANRHDVVLLGDVLRGSGGGGAVCAQDDTIDIELPLEMSEKLLALSAELHVTTATIYYVAWMLLLSHFTGKKTVCCNIVLSGRGQLSGFDNTIGMFIQAPTFSCEIPESLCEFCHLLRCYLESETINSPIADAFCNIAKKNISRTSDTIIAVENYPLDQTLLDGRTIKINKTVYHESTSFPFTIVISQGRITNIRLTTSKQRHVEHLPLLLNTYVNILAQIGNGVTDLCDFVYTNPQAVPCRWGKHVADFEGKTLRDFFIDAYKKYSSSLAIIDGKNSITFEGIYSHVINMAANLQSIGVKKGDKIGVALPRGIPQLLTVYSIVLVGGVYVPIGDVPPNRVNRMLFQADVRLVVAEGTSVFRNVKTIHYDDLCNDGKVFNPVSIVDTDIAYILFTSGSTGYPKGCVVSHGAIVNRLAWNSRVLGLSREVRQAYKTPRTFDVSIIEIFAIFFSGHTLYVLPEGDEKLPERILDFLETYRVSYVHFVPSMLKTLKGYAEEFQEGDKLRTLSLIVCSGEILPTRLVLELSKFMPTKQCRIVNLYGPTEAAVDVSYFECSKLEYSGVPECPIGGPIWNTGLLVLNELMQELPILTEGTLYILGKNLGDGYINEDKLSQDGFVSLQDGRAYQTGDMAFRLPGGEIVVTGRADGQIKHNGVRIESAEIEHKIIESGLYKNAFVFVEKRQHGTQLVACCVGDAQQEFLLRKHLEHELPSSMLPSLYMFVPSLPLTSHGKVDRRKLASLIEEKPHDHFKADEATDIETRLSCLWRRVLGTKCTYHSNDDFFAVGGSSILLIQLLIEIRKQWNVRIESSSVYGRPTLHAMAKAVRDALSSCVGISATGFLRPAISSRIDIFTFCQTHPESTAYNMPILLELTQECDLQDASMAFLKVVSKCGFTKKRFRLNNGQIEEYFSAAPSENIEKVQCNENDFEGRVQALVRPFDLNRQLVRVAEVRVGKRNFLFLDIHHILCDQSVIRFLADAFVDVMEGRPFNYSEGGATAYKVSGAVMLQEGKTSQDKRGLLLSEMSVVWPDQVGMLGHHLFSSSSILSERIINWCRLHACTPFQFLFSAFGLFCGRVFDKNEVVIATNTTADQHAYQDMMLRVIVVCLALHKDVSFPSYMSQTVQQLANAMKDDGAIAIPSWDVMFIREEPIFSDKRFSPFFKSIRSLGRMAKNPLSLFYSEVDGCFRFSFDYDKGYFEKEAIELFSESYLDLLSMIVSDNSLKLYDGILLPSKCMEKLQCTNTGEQVDVGSSTIQEMFVMHCEHHPDSILIKYEGHSISAKAFLRRCASAANVIRQVLRKFNETESPLVAILVKSNYDYLTAVMGTLMAGATFVPLDPSHPKRRNANILGGNHIHFCISDEAQDEAVHWISPLLFTSSDEVSFTRSRNAYCIFTSGTTGDPKGCVVSQKNLMNYLEWAEKTYCRGDKQGFAFFTSPAVDMTITSTLLPLAFGHTIIIFDNEAPSVLSALSHPDVTVLKVTPSHLQLVRNYKYPSARLNALIVGGEQLTSSLARSASEIVGDSVPIFNEYGPTESTVGCMIYVYNPNDPFPVVPIGTPIQNMQISIRNVRGELCFPGTIGEICLEGMSVISGYLDESNRIHGGFSGSPEHPIYHTGDLARQLTDGRVIYEGRRDGQCKIRGFRVELSEIVSAAEATGEVQHAYAIVNNGHLVLFCVPRFSGVLSEVKFRKALFEQLPQYMMPSRILMVDAMPLSPSGKIDHGALLRMLSAQSDGKISCRDDPRTDTIIGFVRSCWETVLNRSDFDNESGFMEAGGTSINIITLREHLARKYPHVTTADLFCYPSIRTQTEFLQNAPQGGDAVVKAREDRPSFSDIAITGIAFRLPGARNLYELRDLLVSGKDCFHVLHGQRRDDECRRLRELGVSPNEYRFARVASLDRIDLFDFEYFRIGRDEACAMDPAQRILLATIDDSLCDAGFGRASLQGRDCAVILTTPTDIGYREYIETVFPTYSQNAPTNAVNSSLAGRIQYTYDMHGPAFLVDCACSTGLAAVHTACNLIQQGQCNMALVGGINLLDTVDYKNRSKVEVLSPHHFAAPFSMMAEGTSQGEGCICFVLEDINQAIKEHRPIYAVIKGCAMNNDGFSSSPTAPNGRAQEQVLVESWKRAQISSQDLDLIETHGTATKLGDQIEIESLCRAAAESSPGHCALSSAKAIFGHLDSIAGLLGMLKCIASIQYGVVFPTNRYRPLVNEINWLRSPFYVPNEIISLQKDEIVCGVSSFGLSGTNVHVVLSGTSHSAIKSKSYKTRLNEVRCWLPDTPEVYCHGNDDSKQIHSITPNDCDEDVVLEKLSEKVSDLYGEDSVKVTAPLYSLGFDSVSVIQLRLFIKSNFFKDVEVTAQDTLAGLAKQVVMCSKTDKSAPLPVVHDSSSEEYRHAASDLPTFAHADSSSWYHLQIRHAFDDFFRAYLQKTSHSRSQMLAPDLHWANGRFMTGHTLGLGLLAYPIVASRADGTELWDVDGNHYIDFAMGFGSVFFGYNHPYIAEKVGECLKDGVVLGALMKAPFSVAERICRLTGVERVSFCNSGTEAIMNLIRIARAARSCNKIVMFSGAFHGTYDPVYVQNNEWENGVRPVPRSAGTPLHYLDDVVMLTYGADQSIEYITDHADELAAVLVEPVQSRHPDLRPVEFIQRLRQITQKSGVLLIFDEVITGFRCGLGGAQAFYGVTADLVAFGKIIGGGFPIGIFGGKAQYMNLIDHGGPFSPSKENGKWVSTGGTFNGHPATMAAASAVLDLLEKSSDAIYKRVGDMTKFIVDTLNNFFAQNNVPIRIEAFGSQFIFTGNNLVALRLLQYLLVHHGIYVWEGGTCFVSAAHTWDQVTYFVDTIKNCVTYLQEKMPDREKSDVLVAEEICGTDYQRLKRITTEHPSIREIVPLEAELRSVLSYNIAHHATRQDVASITIRMPCNIKPEKLHQGIEVVLNAHRHLQSGMAWRHLQTPVYLTYDHVCPIHNYYEFSTDIDLGHVEEVRCNRNEMRFVLEKPPLVIFDSFHAREETIVVMTYYNSWFDGWSADQILFEIMEYVSTGNAPSGLFNWTDYRRWKDCAREKAKAYWHSHRLILPAASKLPVEIKDWYEKRIPLPERIVDGIRNYCSQRNLSKAIAYLYLVASALQKECIWTGVSGRNAPVDGILAEVGLFSGLVPLQVATPEQMQKDLDEMARYPACSLLDLAMFSGTDLEKLSASMATSAIVVLNQGVGARGNVKIMEDRTYVYVPFRCYILLDKELIITAEESIFHRIDADGLLNCIDSKMALLY